MRIIARLSLSLLATSLVTTGCASLNSIVKKPEIHQVKRIAIISITAPQQVPHKNGKGQVNGWGAENRTTIADQALGAYEAEFRKLGWEVIPAEQLSTLPEYQANFAPKMSKADNSVAKALNAISTMSAENGFFSPKGLFPVVWEEDKAGQGGTLRLDLGNFSIEKTKDLKSKMQEVAAKVGADAAVLVQADYCYDDGAFWIGKAGGGTGSAVMTGASAIYAVNPKGDEVIKMKRITAPCGGSPRFASDSSTFMVSGFLLYKPETIQKMFLEVAQKAAADNVKQIRDAMAK